MKRIPSTKILPSDPLAEFHYRQARALLCSVREAYKTHGDNFLTAFSELLHISPYLLSSIISDSNGFLLDSEAKK